MPNELSGKARLRLERFAAALREFGLVDRAGIGPRLALCDGLTLAVLRQMLLPLRDSLPRGVNLSFLAKSVFAALAQVAPETEAWRRCFVAASPVLNGIPPGKRHASKYEQHVFELLKAIFDGSLTNGVQQQEVHNGIQRVDIMFDNARGVFRRIAKQMGRPSPYIPFECKNYVGDVGNPEFDQLSGRLNPSIGAIGVLVFRSVRDWGRANIHCQVKLKDSKCLILLDDSDLTALYQARRDGDPRGVDRTILGRLRALTLNIPAK